MQIIKDKSKLSSHIANAIKQYQSSGRAIHVSVVSALYHAATTGDPRYLTQIYEGLRSNDQTAVRMYIRRVSAIVGLDGGNPDGLANEVINAAVERGGILTFKEKKFQVIQGHTSDAAKLTATLCEERFISPDGENDREVLARNNFAEVRTLGDEQVLDNLLKVLKSIDTESETRKVVVSEHVKTLFAKVRSQAESMKQQLSLQS